MLFSLIEHIIIAYPIPISTLMLEILDNNPMAQFLANSLQSFSALLFIALIAFLPKPPLVEFS